MNKILLFLLLLFQISLYSQTKDATYLYVAPLGNDQWSGRLPVANKDGSDGPFKSLQKAKLKVEELNRSVEAKEGIVIMLREGIYEMNKIDIGLPKGDFKGMVKNRTWNITLNAGSKPEEI